MEYEMDPFVSIGAAIARETWIVSGQMAPYLLFGFGVAGLLSAFVSPAWLERHLGGKGFLPIVKAVLLGVPLPLCSCGVIAVTASIRQHGAGRAAATGFLIATPQTGVDSILATWGVFGPVLGLLRPIIALLNGLLGGLLVLLWGEKESNPSSPTSGAACANSCCAPPAAVKPGFGKKALQALRYGFVTLPGDIARPLIVGIVAAGVISALAPPDALAPYIGGGLLSMGIMILIGIPLYVCATASIPLAVGFIHLGASPGAALAFLIAGPATNAATVATMWSMMGRRTTMLYLASVAFTAVAAGLGYDRIAQQTDFASMAAMAHHHAIEPELSFFFPLLLLVMILYSMMEKRFMTSSASIPSAPMERPRVILSIHGMTCSHCAAAVTRALEAIAGAGNVSVNLSEGRAVIFGEGLDSAALAHAVSGLGYDVSVLA